MMDHREKHIQTLESEVKRNNKEKLDRIDKLLIEMDNLALQVEKTRMQMHELKEMES